jgi:hypothetical protein
VQTSTCSRRSIIAGSGAFDVVGVGSVMVARDHRRRGLMRRVVQPLLDIASQLAPERAMLFCRREMPLVAMWRTQRPGIRWPPGRVDVRGRPF